MHDLRVHTRGAMLTPALQKYVMDRVARKLKKFAPAIQRVTVRIDDINGPRGGIDKRCRAKVVLRGLPNVLVEHQDHRVRAAVDGALRGTATAVRGALGRRRTKQRVRPPARALRR
jgi:ribosome-associated translation inhibitor RaiA